MFSFRTLQSLALLPGMLAGTALAQDEILPLPFEAPQLQLRLIQSEDNERFSVEVEIDWIAPYTGDLESPSEGKIQETSYEIVTTSAVGPAV